MFFSKSDFFIYAGIAIAAFGLGYNIAASNYKLELKELENSFLKKSLENQIKSNEASQAINSELAQIENNAVNEIKNIHADYRRLTDSVQQSDSNAGEVPMPESAKSADRPGAKCNCRQSPEFRQLKKQYVEMAYKCDLRAEKYNRLLKIYLSVQKEIEQFNK